MSYVKALEDLSKVFGNIKGIAIYNVLIREGYDSKRLTNAVRGICILGNVNMSVRTVMSIVKIVGRDVR